MGTWTAEFDYFLTGNHRVVEGFIEVSSPKSPPAPTPSSGLPPGATYVPVILRGSHHVKIALSHPDSSQETTQTVTVKFRDPTSRDIFVSQQVEQTIDWPSEEDYAQSRGLSDKTPDQILRTAQDLIAKNSDWTLAAAKSILEKLLHQNPRLDTAYVELARVAERSDANGPEGLHQAETLLASALQIRPDNSDAKILLGHIYAQQHRAVEAEKLFAECAAANASSPWLWADWGEMLANQHKADAAIAKYRHAIAQPMTHEPTDRARKFDVKWAETASPERSEFLNEARLYLPTGPTALYQLATSDRTAPALKQLLASGEKIDQKDNDGRTALSYALEKGDLAAARRLLVLHARPDISIGPGEVPLALMPVMEENLAAIRLLREFGINYSRLSFRGHTAIEVAKQSQNHELLKALGGGGTSL